MATTTGTVQNVTAVPIGSVLRAATTPGNVVGKILYIDDAADFQEGGMVRAGGEDTEIDNPTEIPTGGGLLRIGGTDPNAEIVRYVSVWEPDEADEVDDDFDPGFDAAMGQAQTFGGEFADSANTFYVDDQEMYGEVDETGGEGTSRYAYEEPQEPGGRYSDVESEDEWDEEGEESEPSQLRLTAPLGEDPSYVKASLQYAWEEGTRVDVWDSGAEAVSTEWRALVRPASDWDADDSIDAIVAFPIVPLLPEGVRDEVTAELVTLDDSIGQWVVVNVFGRQPAIQGGMITRGSVMPDQLGFAVGEHNVTVGTRPSNPQQGDIWFDPEYGYRMMSFNEDTGQWQIRQWGSGALAPGAVGATQIAGNSITQAQLAANSVGQSQLQSGAVGGPQLAPGSVGANAIAPGSVGSGALVRGVAIRTFLGTHAPDPSVNPSIGDLWIYVDTDGGMQFNRWDPDSWDGQNPGPGNPPGGWEPLVMNVDALAANSVAAGQIIAGTLAVLGIIEGSFQGTIGGDRDLYTSITYSVIDVSTFYAGADVDRTVEPNVIRPGGKVLVYSAPDHTQRGSQTFIANNTAWPIPPGVTSITVECWGAGGGGGAQSATSGYGGNGGGGGSYARRDITVPTTGTRTLNVTVGSGGTAGNMTGTSATNGGQTSVVPNWAGGTATRANGGTAGRSGQKGVGGTGPGATVAFAGGAGQQSGKNTFTDRGGGGGSSAGTGRAGRDAGPPNGYLGAVAVAGGGAGGNGGLRGANGSPGAIPGGGGGGRGFQQGNVGNAGSGARGEARVTYVPASAGPQLLASAAGMQSTDAATGSEVTVRRGLRVYRYDLAGFVGGYYQTALLPLNFTSQTSQAAAYPLTPLRAGPRGTDLSDFGDCFDYANGRWICPALGLYEFNVGVVWSTWSTTPAQAHVIFLIANSSARGNAFVTAMGYSTYDAQLNAHGLRWCSPGDYVQANVRQASGSDRTIDAGAPGSYFSVRRVS